MAISKPHYELFKNLNGQLPRGGSLLEIGEANWYGDVEPYGILGDTVIDPACEMPLEIQMREAVESNNLFAIAKAFYASTFAPVKIVSVDMHGTKDALRHDLNSPLPLDERFDLVINHGTAEHIFNIGQVFKTMHDCCQPGGLMIHESPFTGWIDHGFYSLHPTLFYDLATANNYEIIGVWLEVINPCQTIRLEHRDHVYQLAERGELPNNAMLFVVYRRLGDMAFRVPMQGYYARTLSPAAVKAWEGGR